MSQAMFGASSRRPLTGAANKSTRPQRTGRGQLPQAGYDRLFPLPSAHHPRAPSRNVYRGPETPVLTAVPSAAPPPTLLCHRPKRAHDFSDIITRVNAWGSFFPALKAALLGVTLTARPQCCHTRSHSSFLGCRCHAARDRDGRESGRASLAGFL
jgi:hypothetical protein